MPQASWQASTDGRYWLDAAVGNQVVRVMIGLGMVDPLGEVGFEVDPRIYDQIERAVGFPNRRWRRWRDASGHHAWIESRLTTSQLMDPFTPQPVGPLVHTYITRGSPGVPSRVGVVFFHHLAGCRVVWQLDRREWRIETP